MATASHKRQLSTAVTPTAKRPSTKAHRPIPQRVYMTMSYRKFASSRAYSGWNEIRKFHHAYQSEEDAESAIKDMANGDPWCDDWIVERTCTGLYIYNEREDYAENYIEFRVERLEVRPAGCTERVKLHQETESEEEEEDEEDEGDDDEVEILDVRALKN